MNDSPSPLFCPSCAAPIENAAASGAVQCPVCGTEFTPSLDGPVEITDTMAPGRKRAADQLLLERLQQEEKPHKPLPIQTLLLVLIGVAAISFGILKLVSKQDVYAPASPHDTTEMAQKHAVMQPIIDSMKLVLAKNPSDTEAILHMANAQYDAGNWNESVQAYTSYLTMKPWDADARVDYAYAIAQQTGDIEKSLAQIDSALALEPDHLNALINAGILSAQMMSGGNHHGSLKRARSYFERAKAIALKKDPAMAARIDTLLQAIDRTGQRIASGAADSAR